MSQDVWIFCRVSKLCRHECQRYHRNLHQFLSISFLFITFSSWQHKPDFLEKVGNKKSILSMSHINFPEENIPIRHIILEQLHARKGFCCCYANLKATVLLLKYFKNEVIFTGQEVTRRSKSSRLDVCTICFPHVHHFLTYTYKIALLHVFTTARIKQLLHGNLKCTGLRNLNNL